MRLSRQLDRIAIALSTLCIVHCLAVPILVVALPVAALSAGDSEHFHGLMLWLVVPVSVVGFALGHRTHEQTRIVLLGIVGLLVLFAAAIWGHGVWLEAVEVLVSVAGSLILATAHWLNFRAVRRLHRHS
ncbi:MerC domain-containing protein [Candidatus Rariloculus sp.]|uniref:MerC domain-containing protein n=1 Tax=Candidatus Rariloculus sp. TaxID=3101265 RepID=UPI003D0DDA93